MSKISSFLKIELYPIYIPLKNAKIYLKVNFTIRNMIFLTKLMKTKFFSFLTHKS